MTEPEVKDVGLVYKIITDGISQYFGHYTRLYKYDALRKFYVSEAKKAYADRGDAFPAEFFEAMADAVLRWAWDGWEQCSSHSNLMTLFKKLWKAHRRFLLIEQWQDEQMDDALRTFDEIVASSPQVRHIRQMSVSILRHIEACHKEDPAKDDTVEDIA